MHPQTRSKIIKSVTIPPFIAIVGLIMYYSPVEVSVVERSLDSGKTLEYNIENWPFEESPLRDMYIR